MPSAPRSLIRSSGALMSRRVRPPTSRVEMRPVSTFFSPDAPCSATGAPLGRLRRAASSVEMTVRSAPVSMMKANGPWPSTFTGSVIRVEGSSAIFNVSVAPGAGCA